MAHAHDLSMLLDMEADYMTGEATNDPWWTNWINEDACEAPIEPAVEYVAEFATEAFNGASTLIDNGLNDGQRATTEGTGVLPQGYVALAYMMQALYSLLARPSTENDNTDLGHPAPPLEGDYSSGEGSTPGLSPPETEYSATSGSTPAVGEVLSGSPAPAEESVDEPTAGPSNAVTSSGSNATNDKVQGKRKRSMLDEDEDENAPESSGSNTENKRLRSEPTEGDLLINEHRNQLAAERDAARAAGTSENGPAMEGMTLAALLALYYPQGASTSGTSEDDQVEAEGPAEVNDGVAAETASADVPTEAETLPAGVATEAETLPSDVPTEAEPVPVNAPTEAETLPAETPAEAEHLPADVPAEVETLPVETPVEVQILPAEAPAEVQPLPAGVPAANAHPDQNARVAFTCPFTGCTTAFPAGWTESAVGSHVRNVHAPGATYGCITAGLSTTCAYVDASVTIGASNKDVGRHITEIHIGQAKPIFFCRNERCMSAKDGRPGSFTRSDSRARHERKCAQRMQQN
ncbi:hypothetical protein BDW22DRAFT_619902 [Trametopsis cervina]|nr:hypothetical protein BDW22DRAFT_619902 [Trametopsis cervina]